MSMVDWTQHSVVTHCIVSTLLLACCLAALQDGDNINNIITVLPRDATDNAIRERLLSQTGALNTLLLMLSSDRGLSHRPCIPGCLVPDCCMQH
jgi:hypothetical protein